MDQAEKPSNVTDGEAQRTYYELPPGELPKRLSLCPDDTLLLVDFDDTLWLSNSTEQFIASVRPSILVSILLQTLDLLQPWRWLSGNEHRHYRDLYRIRLLLFLFPWCRRAWIRKAEELGPKLLNLPLSALLKGHRGQIQLVSYGFDFIIQPLLRAASLKWPVLVCSSLESTVTLRRRGKAEQIRLLLGDEKLRHSWCLTDSLLDRDMLEACGVGLLCRWPASRPVRAGIDPMMPLVYTKKVKRPTESYITRAIFGHDYLTLLLVFALASPQPLLCAASLFCFLMAYFSAYEIGYFENDRLGLLYEEKPKVSDAFLRLGRAFRPWFAWSCAALLAVAGAWLAQELSWIPQAAGRSGIEAATAIWLAFMLLLLTVRAVFAWFNRIRERGRILPMLLLQLARTAGYLAIFSSSVIGALFCFTHGLSKWIPYVTYRFGGSRKGMPLHLFNCLMLLLLLLIFWVVGALQPAQLLEWHAIIILLYVLVRAAKDLWGFREFLAPLKPVDHREVSALADRAGRDKSA